MTKPDELKPCLGECGETYCYNKIEALRDAGYSVDEGGYSTPAGTKYTYQITALPTRTPDQQAYDRAMAHNAMLRAALKFYTDKTNFDWDIDPEKVLTELEECSFGTQVHAFGSTAKEALNATKADAEAWEKKLRQEVMLAVHPLQPEYEKLQQQLATVTAERDALREYADHKFGCWHNHEPVEGTKFGTCTCGFEALAQKADT